MLDITPTTIEFSQFVQGINAIKSKNKQFRFNPKIMADLKASAVYQFFKERRGYLAFGKGSLLMIWLSFMEKNITIADQEL